MPHKDQEARKAYERAYYQKNREKKIQCARAHQAAHKEERAAYLAQYAAENRATLQAYHREWEAKHPDKKRAYRTRSNEGTKARKAQQYQDNLVEERKKRRIDYANNRAVRLQKVKDYAVTHPHMVRANQARRRARKSQAVINDFTHAQWVTMQELYEHHCLYCGKRSKGHLTQDHIIPLTKQGNHTWDNIVPACRACNARKHTNPPPFPLDELLKKKPA